MEILFNQNCVQIKTLFNVVLKEKRSPDLKSVLKIYKFYNNIAIKTEEI